MDASEYPFCRAVVIGGGTGAPVSIRALLSLGVQTSAVVAMADDGGSTGILRERAGAIPPGDIRKCLVAMSQYPDDPFVRALQYRFDYADNHTLGNLLLTALTDTAGSFPEAIAICEDLVGARGHVYPSTLDSVVLSGVTRDGMRVDSQVAVSASKTALQRVFLDVENPRAYPKAVKAILEADLIVLGPGSLFTSIIPNLLVPEIIDAIHDSRARTVFVCSLADMQGETWGLDVAEHVEALLDHGMRGRLDAVLLQRGWRHQHHDPLHTATTHFAVVTGDEPAADNSFEVEIPSKHAGHLPKRVRIRRVPLDASMLKRIQDQGPVPICLDMADTMHPTWHDPRLLADAFAGILKTCPSPRG